MGNPFTPAFGTIPNCIAGRQNILNDMKNAFANPENNPDLTGIFVGPGGTGKTVLLSLAGEIARNEGWIVVDVAAYDGMLEDIYMKICDQAEEILSDQKKTILKEIKIKDIGLAFEQEDSSDRKPPSWRIRMERLINELRSENVGVLITVDEMIPGIPDMIELVSEYQILQRRGAKVSLLMAGLPKYTDELLNDKSVSFLRRARKHMIGRVSEEEASMTIANTMNSGGKTIEGQQLQKAAAASNGFPYMIQLVGYYIYQEAGNRKKITEEITEKGIEDSSADFTDGVLYSTFSELSEMDRAFVYAMLEDKNGSRLKDITKRLNKSNGYAFTYKTRLQRAGVIDEKNKILNFSLPFFREYAVQMKEYE